MDQGTRKVAASQRLLSLLHVGSSTMFRAPHATGSCYRD
jgi:hypothetical protein